MALLRPSAPGCFSLASSTQLPTLKDACRCTAGRRRPRLANPTECSAPLRPTSQSRPQADAAERPLVGASRGRSKARTTAPAVVHFRTLDCVRLQPYVAPTFALLLASLPGVDI